MDTGLSNYYAGVLIDEKIKPDIDKLSGEFTPAKDIKTDVNKEGLYGAIYGVLIYVN
jgi:hypothetical protein